MLAAQPVAEANLSLKRALELMRARDPNLQLAQTAVDQALADKITAGERPNATLAYSTSKINPAGHNGPGNYWNKSFDTVVSLSQPIERGGKRKHRLAQAEANADAAHADYADSVRGERVAVTAAYWELKRAEEKYKNAQTLAEIEHRSIAASEQRLRVGDLPRLDVERMRIDAAAADNAVDSALGALRDAQVALAALIDVTAQSQELSVADDWPHVAGVLDAPAGAGTSRETAEAVLARRPDMVAAMKRVNAAEAALQLAHAQTSRDITISGQYEHNPMPTPAPTVGHTLLGVGVSVPIFTGNQYKGEIARAYADIDAAKANLAKVRVAALADVHRARADLAAAAQRAHRYDSDLTRRALDTEKTVETAYARGGLALADLLDARRSLKATQDDATDAHADFAEALAALAAAAPEDNAGMTP
ncbi:MAG: TolC family protein [Rudaea sp.]|uniref:TolC family protein n=1 Tax=unclassified Rudaea TaxID=2627037 RepID=UPI0014857471|nr:MULTISPECIES: TolC family protein [unclassified Rudaea]MBN8885428.1 TolC family protein [Rudaea sp.]